MLLSYATIMHMAKKIVVIIIIAACLGIAGIVLHAMNSSSVGTINLSRTSQVPEKLPRTTVTNQWSSFSYGDGLVAQRTDAVSPPVLGVYSYDKPVVSPWNLTIQIRQLPSGNLADDGSYAFRQANSLKYVKEPVRQIGQNSVIIFSDPSVSFAKSAFMAHGGLEANVSLSGGRMYDAASMQAELDTLLASWHWR